MHGYWAITAQIETRDGAYEGSRQIPTFYLHGSVQGIRTEDDAERVARDILTAAVGADSHYAAPLPVMHIEAVEL
jgi:hypothetical protein